MSLWDITEWKKGELWLSKEAFDTISEKESDPDIRCHYCGRFDVPTFFEPDYLDEHVCWDCLIAETRNLPDKLHVERKYIPKFSGES